MVDEFLELNKNEINTKPFNEMSLYSLRNEARRINRIIKIMQKIINTLEEYPILDPTGFLETGKKVKVLFYKILDEINMEIEKRNNGI